MKKTTLFLSPLLAFAPAAFAVIDFEFATSDNQVLSHSANIVDGGATINFWFDNDGTPDDTYDGGSDSEALLEAVGADGSDGFQSTAGADTFDSEASGSLGSFFLRTPSGIAASQPTLIIDYQTLDNVTNASGEIWDIDGRTSPDTTESWEVTAYDGSGSIIGSSSSLTAPGGPGDQSGIAPGASGSFDSLPWLFTAGDGSTIINFITIEYTGTAGAVGLAFDNFNATAVPEPSAFGVIFGLSALIFVTRRRKARA